ncbi:hypothetical protein ACFOS3_19615 [Paractinoplanes deccanensis]
MRHVGVEQGADPRPMRRDQPVVRRPQLAGDLPQPRRRAPREPCRRRGRIVAEGAREAGPHLPGRGTPQRRQVLVDRRLDTVRRGQEELGPRRPVADQQGPGGRQAQPVRFLPGPAQPAQMRLGRAEAAEQEQPSDGLGERRHGEPGAGQLRDVEINRQGHVRIV